MFQIPLKEKYRVQSGGRQYPRNHSGNGNKKKKKLGSGNSDPYVKRDHVLVLQSSGKKKFLHNQNARNVLS